MHFTNFSTDTIKTRIESMFEEEIKTIIAHNEYQENLYNNLNTSLEDLARKHLPSLNTEDFRFNYSNGTIYIYHNRIGNGICSDLLNLDYKGYWHSRFIEVLDIKDFEINARFGSYKWNIDELDTELIDVAATYSLILKGILELKSTFNEFAQEWYTIYKQFVIDTDMASEAKAELVGKLKDAVYAAVESHPYVFGTNFEGILPRKTAKSGYKSTVDLVPIFVKARQKYMEISYIYNDPDNVCGGRFDKMGEIKKEDFYKAIADHIMASYKY